MNILVIGGAGYIGSHCVRQLPKFGHKPVVLDNLIFGHRNAVPKSIAFYEGDMDDTRLLRKILQEEKIDLVMHYAAYAFVGESVENPLKYYFNNLVAPMHVLKTMLEEKVMKFVFSSSCATYGVPSSLPITEETPQNPVNPYGQTKLDFENVLRSLSNSHGLSFASLRYFNAAGAAEDGSIGEDHTPETHLIPIAIEAALGKRESVSVFGTDYDTPDGTCLRDYIHVDDLATAHILSFEKLKTPGTGLFYNLGIGKPYSVKEVISAVEKISGKSIHTIETDRRPGDPPALYTNSEKAQKELNWGIKFQTLESIIETAWKWHSRN